MKRALGLLIVFLLILIMLPGCSATQTSAPQKTEEELRAEVKAEMEAETQMKKELEAQIREELETKIRAEQKAEQKQKDETTSTVLSVFMTKDEIIEKLGDNYIFETKEDGGYFMYYSELAYDDIKFNFYHDKEKLPSDKYPDFISITSNKYNFNYDFNIGDSALKAFEYYENNFENVYDHHSDKYIYDAFYYKEKNSSGDLVDTGMIIRWDYDTSKDYSSKDEISEDVKIKAIHIFTLLD